MLGPAAVELLVEAVPRAVESALLFASLDADALRVHVESVEDARELRRQLAATGLVAFVADGAHLPRLSGADDRPLPLESPVPFRSPAEVTAEARAVAAARPTRRRVEGGEWHALCPRVPLPASLDPRRGHRDVHVRTHTEERILFGTQEVELSAVEQLVEPAQTRALGQALIWARGRAIDGRLAMRAALEEVMSLQREGLDAFQEYETGELAEFRIFELAAFVNRVRSLRCDVPPV